MHSERGKVITVINHTVTYEYYRLKYSLHVTYFYDHLKTLYGSGTEVKLTKLAHDGDKTNELLSKLNNVSNATVIDAIKNADMITISIGGNNLMQAAGIPGFTNIDWALADQGVADFKDQWPAIIDRIKNLNTKNAHIIVMTCYNPYNITLPSGYSKDAGLHEMTNLRLGQINDAINSNVGMGYKVADVYNAFLQYQPSSMGEITFFYPSLFSYLLRNPHPNSKGQSIITELHKQVLQNSSVEQYLN